EDGREGDRRLRRGIRGQVPEGARVAHEGSGQAALFLRLPRGALEASEDHESNRERLCHRAAPAAGDQGSGVEKAGTSLRLQAAGHGGPALAQARRRPAPPPGASGGEVQRRHHAGAARSRRAEGCRLITPEPQHLTLALSDTLMSRFAASIRAQRATSSSSVMVTFLSLLFMTRIRVPRTLCQPARAASAPDPGSGEPERGVARRRRGPATRLAAAGRVHGRSAPRALARSTRTERAAERPPDPEAARRRSFGEPAGTASLCGP